MNTTPPPVGPTEQEVREHFGAKLSPASPLMRPAYTSIWALEDGTLLWDWKEGYAALGPKLKCIIYLTGPQGSGKSTLVSLMRDAVEVRMPETLIEIDSNLEFNRERETIVFTESGFSAGSASKLKRLSGSRNLEFLIL